jgi:hypothetical protein
MKTRTEPEGVVRAVVVTDHDAFGGSIAFVHAKHAGADAVYAVAFEQRSGRERRGFFGLRRDRDGAWQPSGAFLGSAHVTGAQEVFMTYGGWGPGTAKEHAVFGGWVADPDAVSARLADPVSGAAFSAEVVNGVVIFMSTDEVPLRYAGLELLDATGRVLRSGPARRNAVA